MMTSICFIHPYFGNGGAEKGLLTLASNLRLKGADVYLVCINLDTFTDRAHSFSKVFLFPRLKTWQLIFHMPQIINEFNINYVVINQAFAISALAIPLHILRTFRNKNRKFKLGAFERLNPKAFFSHGPWSHIKKLLYYQSLAICDSLLSNSHEQRLNYCLLFPGKDIIYVPNTCDDSHFLKDSLSNKTINVENHKSLLWIGRLEKIKNPLIALQSLLYLPDEWHLTFCGHGSLKHECMEFIKKKHLEGRVRFKENHDVDMSEFNCLLITSQFEGLPNVIIEALNNNLPIISTQFCTGLLELFIPCWVYISSTNKPSSLANSILFSQGQSESNCRLKNPVAELIRSHYSTNNMIAGFELFLHTQNNI